MLKFITGNKNKFEEAKLVFSDIEQLDFDLAEIQEVDPKKIIEHKLLEAAKKYKGEFFVEDQSMHLDALNGLPGPFIKWFWQGLGNQGLFNLVSNLKNDKAHNRISVGYFKSPTEIVYFENIVSGRIVEPKGDLDFGWGPVFMPDGSQKTYGEMEKSEKEFFNPRTMAFQQLKKYLKK